MVGGEVPWVVRKCPCLIAGRIQSGLGGQGLKSWSCGGVASAVLMVTCVKHVCVPLLLSTHHLVPSFTSVACTAPAVGKLCYLLEVTQLASGPRSRDTVLWHCPACQP